jgi:predicted lipoprotein with Yx(FWY)xxD motif
MKKLSMVAALAATLLLSTHVAQAQGAKVADLGAGKALVDPAGMTLYTYDRDSTGKSTCNGACLNLWPPFKAGDGDKGAGDWSVITRSDGAKQWAYKGKPLYRWHEDTKPGDAKGDGVNNVWKIATP